LVILRFNPAESSVRGTSEIQTTVDDLIEPLMGLEKNWIGLCHSNKAFIEIKGIIP